MVNETKTKSKKVSLALGGGGVRACFHIGLYEVLKENNIEISHITGTSMGAIIGAMMAMDMSPTTMRDFALKYKDLDLFSWKNFNYFSEGLVKREEVTKILGVIFEGKKFEDLKVPFACTSVDLEACEEVVFTSGDLLKALEASSAYPLIFAPVFYEARAGRGGLSQTL